MAPAPRPRSRLGLLASLQRSSGATSQALPGRVLLLVMALCCKAGTSWITMGPHRSSPSPARCSSLSSTCVPSGAVTRQCSAWKVSVSVPEQSSPRSRLMLAAKYDDLDPQRNETFLAQVVPGFDRLPVSVQVVVELALIAAICVWVAQWSTSLGPAARN
eukprot:CAMPEP_0197911456 /NCGR_PEP_ID=MMETSP1439-20131203/72846_1 /TAXON_ID=66791 /ORGANISM="Gonyaulax spinifera, Strain CCMP409" /LENGTH=159 /DNA_ID=CAMNT_0043533185 /DNA_START=77 /DNA_END=556 /DNA_ORIENTATION=+